MIDKKYQPQKQEKKIRKAWGKAKAFKARISSKKKPFSIIMPPPNANGTLHIGHAMFVTIQDIISRFQRMKGKSVLWLPGADHAGILTQVVFERKLAEKGKTRYDLGRKKFYQQCLAFTQKNKKIMFSQIRKLGASCDWSKQKFTLDPKISKVVLQTFVKLYKDNLAYRGERMINWCPRCATALSDLEVEHQKKKSKLWFIKYPLNNKSKITGFRQFLVVATTRPETMLGDTALAVNPEDSRYKKFIGKTAILPIVKREIPVIADKKVDLEFGSGVVKVTPAHDPLDWEIGKRHKLKTLRVVNFQGKMTKEAGKEFSGLTINQARQKILKILKKKDFLLKEKNHFHSVSLCERCKTKIETQISKQWFIKIKPLSRKAIKAVKGDQIKIIPANKFKKNFLTWLAKLHDWCVSRQLWWGHQLPIYYCGLSGLSDLQKSMNPELVKSTKKDCPCKKARTVLNKKIEGCGHIMVSVKKPKKCPKCGGTTIIQDPDTFDCWFSSGQWPYTTLGFRQANSQLTTHNSQLRDFNYWYPTSVMETGYEILSIWVARMIMLGIYTTGKIPFKDVYLHGLVRDAFGEKMSKSKGNVINPLDIIEKYGTDALRLALITSTSPGNDVSLSDDKIKGYRNFCNKLWNIGRFTLLHFKWKRKVPFYKPSLKGLTAEDKKIVKKLSRLIEKTTKNLQKYRFSPASEDLYQFVWHELADVYIENVKQRLKNNDLVALSVLRHIFLNCLKMLHPFAPFITEVLWQEMPKKKSELLAFSSWPKAN